MDGQTLAAALEREHREIDEGVEKFAAARDTNALQRAMTALRRHIYLEEEFLFPPLREAGLMAPLFVMVREHGQLWQTMEKLDGELAGGAAGDSVVAACQELMAQLDAHNSKEEPIIYPRADAVLSDEASSQLHAFLASGTMPDGWVCQGARAS
jgi:hemerythrin-like domain-containing protein